MQLNYFSFDTFTRSTYFEYSIDAARLAIFEYIESWYNSEKIHSSLGYITPQEWEDKSKRVA